MENVIFITGTDTGVGKTTIACAIIKSLRAEGVKVGVLKPVETGCRVLASGELVAADGAQLLEAASSEQSLLDVVPYRFVPAVAPIVAARDAGGAISIEKISECIESESKKHEILIVEGAGGLLVPLTDEVTFAELAAKLSMKVIIVVGSRLGALNQAALTFEVARRRELRVLGYILNEYHDGPAQWGEHSDRALQTNPAEIRRIAKRFEIAELGHFPFSESLEAPFAFKLANLE